MTRTTHALLVGLAVVLSALPRPLTAQNAVAIAVEKAPVQVEQRIFPAGDPPLHLRARSAEVAFCESAFTCVVEIRARTRRQMGKPASTHLTGIQFTLGLQITLWLPDNFDRRILEHEQTHQAISEHYYAKGDAVARRIARRLLDETPSLNVQANGNLDARLGELRDRLIAEYMEETHQRSEFAQIRFDALTDHGRAQVTHQKGMTDAVREEETRYRQQRRLN